VSATTGEATDLLADQRALLTSILREAGELSRRERVTAITQLEGGWSRWSHVATATSGDGERRYVVRVKAPSGLFDTDIVVEYDLFRALEDVDLRTPRVFGLSRGADNPFGGEFFVMEFLSGHAPNLWRARDHAALATNWREGDRGIARDAVATLATIHAVAPEGVPANVPRKSYGEQLAHWRRMYEDNRLVRDPILEEAFAWLASRPPGPDPPVGLVHGDYRMGNTLVENDRVTAVLDWELAYVGDVRYDVGYFALDYTAGKHLRPKTTLTGGVAERGWFFEEYERLTGWELDREVVATYSAMGLASLMAMTAVGIRRYHEGRTTDVRRVWARWGLPGMRQELAQLMDW
jgi:aminoglycoside phosphotransferase (APT) family kinase protein